MGIADFAKQAEELADKAKEAAKNVDADQVAETAHDLSRQGEGHRRWQVRLCHRDR